MTKTPCSVFDLCYDRYVSLAGTGACVSDSCRPFWAQIAGGQELHQRALEVLDGGPLEWFEKETQRAVRPHALALCTAKVMREPLRGVWRAKHGTGQQILVSMLVPGGGEWFRHWAQRNEPMFRAIDHAESNDGVVEWLARCAFFRRGVPADVVGLVGTFVERSAVVRCSVTLAHLLADPVRRAAVAARDVMTEEEFGALADALFVLIVCVCANLINGARARLCAGGYQ